MISCWFAASQVNFMLLYASDYCNNTRTRTRYTNNFMDTICRTGVN